MDINSSIKTLKQAIINQSNIEINDPDYVKDVKKKIKYYKIFQYYLYVYWVCEAVVLSWKPFLYLYHEWIFSLAHQVVILIGMSLLFITINCTLNYRKRELMVDFAGMPLPFDKERDAQIWGEIVIIHNIWIDEPNSNRDSDNKSYFPSISIGIERSHHRILKNAIQHNSIHNSSRIRRYLFEDVEEEAKNDILKIINAQNQDLEKNIIWYLNSLTSKKYESGWLEGFNDNENSWNDHCFKLQKFENDWIQFKNNSTNELISPLFQSKVCIDFGDSKRLEAFIKFEKFRSKFKVRKII